MEPLAQHSNFKDKLRPLNTLLPVAYFSPYQKTQVFSLSFGPEKHDAFITSVIAIRTFRSSVLAATVARYHF